MSRLPLTFALLTLAPALAQAKVSFQPATLPYVTLSAPGYTARAEVRPAVTYPESGPNVGPYFQFSPSQIRVVLDRPDGSLSFPPTCRPLTSRSRPCRTG